MSRPTGPGEDPVTARELRLAATLLELADTLADDFDERDFLQTLVSRSAALVEGDAAALSLVDASGEVRTVATTTQDVALRELVDTSADDGPVKVVLGHGRPVVNVPPAEVTSRWPGFATAAEELGYRSCHVVPLRSRARVAGALSVFFRDVVTLGDPQVAILDALTSVATVGLLRERTTRQQEIRAARTQSALEEQALLEQSTGIVAELSGRSIQSAALLVAAYCRRTGLPVSVVAENLVHRRIGLEELLAPGDDDLPPGS